MAEFVKTNIQGDGLAFVTINRPPVNALSMQLISELHAAVNVFVKNKKGKNEFLEVWNVRKFIFWIK